MIDKDRGYYTTLGCIDDNTRRISNSVRKSGANYQCRRKVIRGHKKQKLVKNKKLEGKVYGPGIDDWPCSILYI